MVRRDRQDLSAVAAETCRVRTTRMSHKNRQLLAAWDFPNPCRRVIGDGDQSRAVRAKGSAPDPSLMPSQDGQLLARGRVPEPGDPARVCDPLSVSQTEFYNAGIERDEVLAIRAEHGVGHEPAHPAEVW